MFVSSRWKRGWAVGSERESVRMTRRAARVMSGNQSMPFRIGLEKNP